MGHWPNKYVIGLTGNIAVGKSVIRQMLQHLGAYTVDADKLSHQAIMPGAPAYKPVVQTFGQFILGPDKRINRQMLGQIVFSNPDALKQLESITHPVIRQAVDILIKRAKQRIIVVEAIKLLEGDLADKVDAIWVVDAKPQTQYKRLVVRRQMSEAEAKQRILAQNKQDEKLKKADVVIQNDGNVDETWQQVQTEWNKIRQMLTGGTEPEPDVDGEIINSGEGITVKRGMPNNAASIASFISKQTDKDVSRMDVMMTFGQKSYLVAHNSHNETIGLMGWTVENLVTRMDEFYVGDSNIKDVAHSMVTAVEESSKELQSEVGFIFLPQSASETMVNAFKSDGYEPITLSEIKVPVWREAVEEVTASNPMVILWKQLRQDRVLQPI